MAHMGYSDPSSFCTLMREMLFEKSPKLNRLEALFLLRIMPIAYTDETITVLRE